MMTELENSVWWLIESCRTGSSSPVSHISNLRKALLKLSEDQFHSYTDSWETTVNLLYSYKHWLAFNILLNNRCNEDRFDDCANTLMLYGRDTFFKVLNNPDDLADLDNFAGLERATLLFINGWEDRYPGEILPRGVDLDWAIKDYPVEMTDLAREQEIIEKQYPKLCKKYGKPTFDS